jgi:hypothetical protein
MIVRRYRIAAEGQSARFMIWLNDEWQKVGLLFNALYLFPRKPEV